MNEVEIDGNRYQIGRLDAKTQFHVARRVAPLLSALGQGAAALDGAAPDPEGEVSDGDMLKVFGPLANALSAMDDAQCDYVINRCLSVVRRHNGQQWTPVMAPNGALMFDADHGFTMQVMMRLTIAVIQENIGGFFAAAPAQGSAGA